MSGTMQAHTNERRCQKQAQVSGTLLDERAQMNVNESRMNEKTFTRHKRAQDSRNKCKQVAT